MSEEAKIDATPQEKKEDEITIKLKARSVSLSRNDSRKQSPPPKKTSPPTKKINSPGKGRKRKSPPEMSPKVSVKERTTRFEQVRNKYKTQRCMKEINHEKNESKKRRRPKTAPDEEESSIASLLKTISTDIKSIKA